MGRRDRDDESSSSEAPPREDDRDMRSRLEGVIPELIKRAVRGGVDRAGEASESIRSFLADSKLPKEIISAMFDQIEDTKNGLFRVVAKEVRGFLEAVDFQHEIQKLLTTVSFEIKTEIRFIPNDSRPERIGRPEVKAAVKLKRADRDRDSRRGRRDPDADSAEGQDPPSRATRPAVGESAATADEGDKPPPES